MRVDYFFDVAGINDIVIDPETGDALYVKDRVQALGQRLKLRLETWLGEWKFNTEFGTPYQRILENGAGLPKSVRDGIIRGVVIKDPDVISVIDIISTDDPRTRTYEIEKIIVLTNDGEIEIPLANPALRTNKYPTPPRTFGDFTP